MCFASIKGYIIPINCDHRSPQCDAATVEERDYIKHTVDGGYLLIHSDNTSTESFEYLLGNFGSKVYLLH